MRAFSTSSVVVLMLLVVMGAAATPALAAAADHHHGDALFHAAATAPQLPRRMLKQEQHLSVGAGLPPGYRYNAEVDPYGTRNYVWMQRVEPVRFFWSTLFFLGVGVGGCGWWTV
jgi:hypothetical protein